MQLLLGCLLQLCEKFHSSLQVSIPSPEVHLCNSENILSFGVCWCSLKKKKILFFDSLKRLMQKRTTRGMLRKTHTFLCRLSLCCWTEQNLSWQQQLCKEGKNTGNNKTRRSCFNQAVGSSCNELQLLYKAHVKARSQTNRAWCLSESTLKRKN